MSEPTFDPCFRYLAADPHRWHSFVAGVWVGVVVTLVVLWFVVLWRNCRAD